MLAADTKDTFKYSAVPWFTNASVCKQFSSKTEAFGKILLPFLYSVWGDKHHCGHLPQNCVKKLSL